MRRIHWCRYATPDQEAEIKQKCPGMVCVDPSRVYMDDTGGLILVTSQDWIEWITGKRTIPPGE